MRRALRVAGFGELHGVLPEWQVFVREVNQLGATPLRSYLLLHERTQELRCSPRPSLDESTRLSQDWVDRWTRRHLGEVAV